MSPPVRPRVLGTRLRSILSVLAQTLSLLSAGVALAQNWQFSYDLSGDVLLRAPENILPPQIIGQPVTQVVVPGDLATFSVVLADASATAFQWRFGSSNIVGATGDTLILTNVSAANQGQYSVVVMNNSGSVTSAPAALMLDSVGGGMPDSWQLAYFGNLNQNATGDFDGDGVENLDEFLEGTNPADPASYNPRLHLYTTPYGQSFASPGLPYYTKGQLVTLTAVPDPGGTFLGWTGAATGIKIQISLLMTSHRSVTASFGIPMTPPVLAAATLTNGVLCLSWSALPGRLYQVQFKDGLNQTNWTNLGGTLLAPGLTLTTYDMGATNVQRFYRVSLLP